MTFPNLNILSMCVEGGERASALEWEGAYVRQDGRVGVNARGEGEDKRMGAVKSVTGELCCARQSPWLRAQLGSL